MRARFALVVAGLALVCGCAGGRGRASGGWEPLGTRTVHGRVNTDVIHVGRSNGHFQRIRFIVRGSALEMDDVRVVFGDGDTWSPATRLVFTPADASRSNDLPGGGRIIRRVEFRYGNLPTGGGRARVLLFGR